MQTFGELVRQIRKEKGLSHWKLAMLSGVNAATISAIEKRGVCNLAKAFKIAKALGIESIPVV